MGVWADSTLTFLARCGKLLCRWMEKLLWTHCCCTIWCTFFCCRPVFQNVNSNCCSFAESAEFVEHFCLCCGFGLSRWKIQGHSIWVNENQLEKEAPPTSVHFVSACVCPRCLFLFVFMFCFVLGGSQSDFLEDVLNCFFHRNMLTTKLHLRLICLFCDKTTGSALSQRHWPCFVLDSRSAEDLLKKGEGNYASRYLLWRENKLISRQTRAGRDLNRVRRNTDELCAHCAKPLHKMKIINEKCVFGMQAQYHHNHSAESHLLKVTVICLIVSLCFLWYEHV